MSKPIHPKAQAVSDEFHAIEQLTDQLLARQARLTALTAEMRVETGMSAMQGQRTLRHLGAALPALTEYRNSVTLAHAAAAQDAPKDSFPWECPPEGNATAEAANVPQLEVVGG